MAVLLRLPSDGAWVALCSAGSPCSGEEMWLRVHRLAVSGMTRVALLFGGSVGLVWGRRRRADWRLSMSPMTFPHHLARVMLLEQIYRAFQIQQGTKYHK